MSRFLFSSKELWRRKSTPSFKNRFSLKISVMVTRPVVTKFFWCVALTILFWLLMDDRSLAIFTDSSDETLCMNWWGFSTVSWALIITLSLNFKASIPAALGVWDWTFLYYIIKLFCITRVKWQFFVCLRQQLNCSRFRAKSIFFVNAWPSNKIFLFPRTVVITVKCSSVLVSHSLWFSIFQHVLIRYNLISCLCQGFLWSILYCRYILTM